MIENSSGTKILYLATLGSIFLLLYLSFYRPYLFDSRHLIGMIGLVIAAIIAAQYRTHFWTLFMVVFLWAGSGVQGAIEMQTFRWVLLTISAVVAVALYARSANQIHFNYLHLLGLFTVVAAFLSAIASVSPLMTVTKALSLLALFIYGSIGARILWSRQPGPFLNRLSRFFTVLVYFTAACYALSFPVWGNPNSLGAITGVLCWPVLLWQFLLAANKAEHLRRGFVLGICGFLLMMSRSRASMLAAFVCSILLLVSARRYRTLLTGISLTAAALTIAYLLSPEKFQDVSDSFVYKQAGRGHFLESRQGPWERSITTVREHPWIGLGFGAADNSADFKFDVATPGHLLRERGSSYLTMVEGTGLIGIVPFVLLVLGLARDSGKVFRWLRLTGDVNHPAVPIACLVISGLTHAVFEDWLLAVGYHMTAIFWPIVLSLRDWMAFPATAPLTTKAWAPQLPIPQARFTPVTTDRSSFGERQSNV